MRFPHKVVITAIDSDTGCAIPEVAFVLALRAQEKNDYFVGPFITDRDGRAEFTKEVCEKEIERTKQMFIMDYAGDLASCGTNAELRLQPPANIAGMISQYEVEPAF